MKVIFRRLRWRKTIRESIRRSETVKNDGISKSVYKQPIHPGAEKILFLQKSIGNIQIKTFSLDYLLTGSLGDNYSSVSASFDLPWENLQPLGSETKSETASAAGEKEPNQMRVQLQEGDVHHADATRRNKSDPGVTVAQLRGALQDLFNSGKNKIPGHLESSFLGAIARSSQQYAKYPPGGICNEHFNFWREKFPHERRGPYRLDSENIRGCNLRQ